MKTGKAEVFVPNRYLLGEGPCYASGRLSWVDIKTGTLNVLEGSGKIRSLQTGQYLGAAIPTESGRYIACMTTGLYLLEDDAILHRLDIPYGLETYQRFNDAKCDPRGRLFAGTMPLFMKYARQGGKLYRYEGDASQPLDAFVVVPNGMAWTADERTLYLVDTAFANIDAFDYDPETGMIANRRNVIHIEGGAPDGMTIDAEDKLWVAIWGGGEVRRYDPATSEVLETVKVNVQQVSSCCFGDNDLRTLYITTSSEGENENQQAGCVFAYRTETVGTATRLFNDKY
ncbi:MAG: SMP-30/gluconolactonase/LRE family protein [Eubacteriales bacterium]|nr:SMP-30/gluconolactonase/LRE family protein [Eubacteriales bacterium]